MREKLSAAGLGLLVAAIVAVSATFAWITLSRAPEVTGIATTLSGNGALEIALSKPDGSQPDNFDIDEGAPAKTDVVSSNLQWGNLVNLSDASYGIDNLALRPAQLNTSNLLNSPLWGASYGGDGRITQLDSNYAYAKYKDGTFITSKDLGVRAIATYTTTISDASQREYIEVRDAVTAAHQAVNEAYGNDRDGVPTKFGALGTMISKYAQDKLDKASPGTNLAPYLGNMIPLYEAVQEVMEKQKDAYVALANLQSYLHANNTGGEYKPMTWKELVDNRLDYTAQDSKTDSKNGVVSLVGLKDFIKDLGIIETDVSLLHQYKADYEENGTAYYWGTWSKTEELKHPLNTIVADLIDHGSMTIDLNDDGQERKVTGLGKNDASALLSANGKNRKAYVYNGVLKRLEQLAVDESYRLNGRGECTIRVSFLATITVNGKAYTKASGASDFALNYSRSTEGKELVPSDQVAEDTYGMVVDFWVRTNHETTKLTLEGATVTDEEGEILRYDGVNRIWGATGAAESGTLTRESTTQGGGSCYVYYADTPEDQSRSLRLLEAMKVAFVSASGELLAQGEMDTQNYWAQNGRITVPLALNSETKTTYTYKDKQNNELVGRAITTLQMDDAQRITAIVYLDGTQLTNDMVLAASEVQGQLNLQFGSSENLTTAGDKNLVDKVRRVTATADKLELDYDTATSAEELTTEVTLTVEGAEPTEITAQFVRAINSTQGSRETEMSFTKQADGSWTGKYRFVAPGTYYLRHVRLNGVDYALDEPVTIQVKGFDLKSVSWSEMTSEATIRTSDGTYSEKVWVEFATDDETKMPSTVEARFVRTDGNTVNIPLTRGTGGVWTGTGTFTTSGVYKWEYLVYKTASSTNGSYRDLGDSKKTLDLALGLYVSVLDKSGTQTQPYETGRTYPKDVAVSIYDNAGNALEGLEGARLYYSNGGSATNTINTDLAWEELDGCYNGTLPIAKAGRYQFAYVSMQGGQALTKATDSPIYTIISPDPPIYDETSRATYHGDTLQFVPLTNDAQIDGVKIKNSASATVAAVVHNSETNGYYSVPAGDVRYAGESWIVKLPTYTRQLGEDRQEQTQDGTWTLVALLLTDCYDTNSVFRDETNPIIWVGSDDVSKAYAADRLVDESGNARPYESKDFSLLSTTVSCSVSVTMEPGQTDLGSKSSTEFMHRFAVKDLGMKVTIRDDAGRVIPADKVESVLLAVNYAAPQDDAYGYRVQSGAGRGYEVSFTWDGEQCLWTAASSPDIWQYVGRYTVQKLTVTVKGGKSLTFEAGTAGVPAAYTLMTKSPDSSNISLEDVKQVTKEFGKNSNNNVTGTFLQSYDLGGTNLKVSLTPKDKDGNQYAVLENVTASLKLTYKNGKTAPYGGYSWTDTSAYENITLPMAAGDGNSVYKAEATPLLAGTYSAAIEVKVGKNTTTMNLSDISAWSKAPDVTMALADGTPETVTVNKGGGIEYSEVFTANNEVKDKGHAAVLFANATRFTADNNKGEYKYKKLEGLSGYVDKTAYDTTYSDYFADYSVPSLKFSVNDGGTACRSFTLIIPNNNGQAAVFASGEGAYANVQIGYIEETTADMPGKHEDNSVSYKYKAENVNVIGTQSISTIQANDGSIAYTLKLASELSIVQENHAVPSAAFRVDNEAFLSPEGKTSENGRPFTFILPDELYASKDGKTYVETQITEEGDKETKTEGENLTDKLPSVASVQNGDWTPLTNGNPIKAYVETVKVEKNNHFSVKAASLTQWHNTKADYKKTWTQEKYWIYPGLSQTTSQTVNASGTITSVWDTNYYTVITSLKAWDVDGVVHNPGETITVSGNSIIRPMYNEERTLVQRVSTIEVTNGKTEATYIANRVATITVRPDSKVDPDVTGESDRYCVWKTCADYPYKGSDAAAKAAAEATVVPTIPGYTKKAALTAGTVVSSCDKEWTQYSSNTTGTTTTTKITYDANGNELSRTESTTTN